MKPSNLFILSILWVLVSCTGLGNMPAMENASSSNCNNIIPPEDEETFINNKYLSLLDIVERMRVYTEEEAKITHPILGDIKKTKPPLDDLVELFYEQTLNLLNKKQDINTYLHFLLTYRFTYLVERNKLIDKTLNTADYQETKQTSEIQEFCNPMSKTLFDFVMKDERFKRHKSYNETVRLYSIRRFELLNLLIRESVTKCSLDELAPSTINLLRASVQLHPILTGECKDLGNPDEAGGYHAILEFIMFSSNITFGKNIPRLRKIYSDQTIIRNIIFNKDLKKYNFHFLKTFFWEINAEKQAESKKNSINKLEPITQEILSIQKDLDSYIFEAHFEPKEQIFQLKNIGTSSGKAHQIRGSFTDYEVGKWPYELPYPDFLKKPQEEVLSNQPISPGSTLQHKGKDNQEKKLKSSAKGALKNKKKRNKLDETKQADEHADSIKESKQEEKDQVEEPKELGITLNNPIELAQQVRDEGEIDEGEIQEALSELESGIIPPTNLEETVEGKKQEIQEMLASNFSFIRDWVLPRGLRSFHSQMLTYQYPRQTLNNQYQDTVDRLFDAQQQCNVNFREFKTLWKAVEGQIISNHGGSHRELIGPRQEKLFGIFAHSDSQTYGNGYVKYLQTAALYVGLRPSGWMD
jgi:hypothetical protein